MYKKTSVLLALSFMAVTGFSGCSGGSGGAAATGETSSTSVGSIADLPDVSTLVATSSSSSLSALSSKDAVTGTPPLLKDISSSNADTYFWDGLIATINAASSVTQAQADAFWIGEGHCRMAQTVGYSFQNVLQGGTSLCYMKKMPASPNGVAANTTATGAAISDPSTLFDQGATTKVVKVSVTNEPVDSPGGGGDNTIFLKVFGNSTSEGSAGYAADLWFCDDAGAVGSYEKIRVNASTGVFSSTNVGHHGGSGSTFVGLLSASLTGNSVSGFTFDTTKSRSAEVYFADSSSTFLSSVAISDGSMVARNYFNGSFGGITATNKYSISASNTGNTMDTLRLNEAGFAFTNDFTGGSQSVVGANEYQTNKYVAVGSGSFYTFATSEDFSATIYDGSTAVYTNLANAEADFSCSTSPDISASIDFSFSGPQAVAAACENVFGDNMQFCDGSGVNSARNKVTSAQSGFGSCSTTRCREGDDFSCQDYSLDHPESGLTTANAGCSSGCCAVVR